MAALREEDVTRDVAAWLADLNWKVLSVHFPGTQGGLRIDPSDPVSKSAGSIVPDIVAVRIGCLLLAESKPEFCLADVEKLLGLTSDVRYSESLSRTCALAGQPLREVLLAVCFGGAVPTRYPPGVILLSHSSAEVQALNVSPAHACLFR